MISVNQAAALLNLSPARVRLLCQQGRIPRAKKLGRDWLLPDHPTITPGTRGPALTTGTA